MTLHDRALAVLAVVCFVASLAAAQAFCPSGTSRTLDTLGDTGYYAKLLVGSHNRPVIFYHQDGSSENLMLYDCDTDDCSSGGSRTLVSTNNIGLFVDAAIGVDGNPFVTFYDTTNDDLESYHCGDPDCTGGQARTLDSGINTGTYTAVAIGEDGNPIVAYAKSDGAGELWVRHCADTACTSSTATRLDVGSGEWNEIIIGNDGLPFVASRTFSSENVRVVHCHLPNCTTGGSARTVDARANAGKFLSMVLGDDGFPIMAYRDESATALVVLHCENEECSASTTTTVDNAGDVGEFVSITIRTDTNPGLPVLAYYDTTSDDLKLLICDNVACTTSASKTLVSSGSVGHDTSIAIDRFGAAIIAFRDRGSDDLLFYRCEAPSPSSMPTTSVTASVSPSMPSTPSPSMPSTPGATGSNNPNPSPSASTGAAVVGSPSGGASSGAAHNSVLGVATVMSVLLVAVVLQL